MTLWQPISSAPFGALCEDDDGSVDWGLKQRDGSVRLMKGWDFYYNEPTHWRRKELSDSDGVGQSDGLAALDLP